MPRPSDMGGERQKRAPRKRASLTTHARRARVYEERNQRCFGEYDGCHPGAGGYTGEDGLLYCGKCRKPKEAYFAPTRPLSLARPATRQSATAREPPARNGRPPRSGAGTLTTVEELKRGLYRPHHADWTFENDNGRNPQTGIARRYVEHWEDMRTDNIGCCSGAAWEPGKATLRAVSQTPLWRKKSPST